jgi:hypothetical protein
MPVSRPEALWVLVALAALCLAVLAIRKYLASRPTPEELERRRRETIHQEGKIGDGEIIEVDATSILYSYSVAGVVYTASQDVVALQPRLPQDLMAMVGPVSVKFDPRNPANSIVLCEQWSGLRTH